MGNTTIKNVKEIIIMDDEQKKFDTEDEGVELDDIIREHIAGLIASAEEMPVGDETKFQLERVALSWYTEFTRSNIEANKVVADDTNQLRNRGSAEEMKKAEIEARQKESFINALIDLGKVVLVAGLTTGIPLAVYKSQQDKILAAEYCDNRYVLDKNFADNKNEIMKLIKKFNG